MNRENDRIEEIGVGLVERTVDEDITIVRIKRSLDAQCFRLRCGAVAYNDFRSLGISNFIAFTFFTAFSISSCETDAG